MTMSATKPTDVLLDDLITLEKFSELTGVTRKAVYQKINKGIWREGEQFYRDPQRRIWISRAGYQEWIKQGATPKALKSEETPSRLSSNPRVKLRIATKPCPGQPRQLT